MAIEINGRVYRTLADGLAINGKVVRDARFNDALVYPEVAEGEYVLEFEADVSGLYVSYVFSTDVDELPPKWRIVVNSRYRSTVRLAASQPLRSSRARNGAHSIKGFDADTIQVEMVCSNNYVRPAPFSYTREIHWREVETTYSILDDHRLTGAVGRHSFSYKKYAHPVEGFGRLTPYECTYDGPLGSYEGLVAEGIYRYHAKDAITQFDDLPISDFVCSDAAIMPVLNELSSTLDGSTPAPGAPLLEFPCLNYAYDTSGERYVYLNYDLTPQIAVSIETLGHEDPGDDYRQIIVPGWYRYHDIRLKEHVFPSSYVKVTYASPAQIEFDPLLRQQMGA